MRSSRYVLMITAPILASSLLLLLIGGGAAWYVHQLNREVSQLLERNLDCAFCCERIVIGIRDIRLKLNEFQDLGDPAVLGDVRVIQNDIMAQFAEAERDAATAPLRSQVVDVRRRVVRFLDRVDQAAAETDRSRQSTQIEVLLADLRQQALVPAENLHSNSQRTAEVHTDQNRTISDNIGMGLLVLGVCGSFAGLLAGYGIARGIARRIEQSERELSRSEQLAAIGQLAAGLAHELRNPLTAIRVLVEAGRDQAGDTKLDRRDLEVLDEEIARLEKLISSFLEFARPPQLEKSRIDVRSLIDQTLHLVGGQARQRGVTIEWKRPAAPLEIEADSVQLRQVLLNLLLNAMDAVGEGGRTVVELERRSDATPRGAGCLIRVSDNGQGVPDGMREKIFEPFFSSKETGMGLGLPVSRRIVEAHEGLIRVSENPGGGARFTVVLPISAAASAQDDVKGGEAETDGRTRRSLMTGAR